MKINIAKNAGFCFGVRRALNIARKTARQNECVYMLGDIVHNEDVVREVSGWGIKKINALKPLSQKKKRTLLIRAHGASTDIYKKANEAGYKVVDATCLMVKEIHKIARQMENKGYKIIIIGDQNHDEVKGIAGQLKSKALVVEGPGKIPLDKVKKIKRAAVVSQSTQDVRKVEEAVGILKKYIGEVEFFNTICRPTIIKQQEAKTMPHNNDVMIIIGSKTSANTRRLYEISKSINKKSYWIQSEENIKPAWFKNAKSVGILAGASTPDKTTKKIVTYINNLSS